IANTPASVSRRSRTVSTELAMPSVSRKSLYLLTPDMMASLTMVRFHSSPSRPRAMALEFSVTGTFSGSAVIFRLGFGLGTGASPARDGLARRPAAMRATSDPLGKPSTGDRAAAHVVGPEHDYLGQVAVQVDRERHEIRVVFLGPADARGHADLAAEHTRLELVPFRRTGQRVVLDQPVEHEPARFVSSGVIIAVRPAAEPAVNRAELGVQVGQILLVGGPGDQV